MIRKTFIPEQIINKLRQAEVLLSRGATAGEASRNIGNFSGLFSLYYIEHQSILTMIIS